MLNALRDTPTCSPADDGSTDSQSITSQTPGRRPRLCRPVPAPLLRPVPPAAPQGRGPPAGAVLLADQLEGLRIRASALGLLSVSVARVLQCGAAYRKSGRGAARRPRQGRRAAAGGGGVSQAHARASASSLIPVQRCLERGRSRSRRGPGDSPEKACENMNFSNSICVNIHQYFKPFPIFLNIPQYYLSNLEKPRK